MSSEPRLVVSVVRGSPDDSESGPYPPLWELLEYRLYGGCLEPARGPRPFFPGTPSPNLFMLRGGVPGRMYKVRRLEFLEPSLGHHTCNRCGEGSVAPAVVQARGAEEPRFGFQCNGCWAFFSTEPDAAHGPGFSWKHG